MADGPSAGGSGLPNLNLTAEEKRIYGQLFKAADPDGFQVVSGDVAVKFFEKTALDPRILGEIWQIADTENRGLLTPAGFGVVLRLIGHAQANRPPSLELAAQPGPIPRFEGYNAPAGVLKPQTTGPPSSPTQPSAPLRVPPLPPAKVNDYATLFERSGAQNGMLDGDTAKDIFLKSDLGPDILGSVWSLVDTQDRGALDRTEFVIAMHLLSSLKSKTMSGVPTTLPPGLYEVASRRAPVRQQFTGQGRPQSPAVRQFPAPMSAQSTGEGWIVNPAEKARFDVAFTTVDTARQGFITGDLAVPFFKSSGLDEEDLAQIWDLADVNRDGILNKDEFAVAMYLIRQKKQGGLIPETLPPALIPPTMRRQNVQAVPAAAPVFENAPSVPQQPQAKSAADDLFGLDAFTAPSSPPPTQIPQSTGGSAAPFQSPSSPVRAAQPTGSTFKPFVPSSSFGQSIIPQSTGSPAPPQQARSPPAPSDDLLGDADPEVSNKLTSETTELANLSNQVGNLSKQMQEVQNNREVTGQQLSQSNQQKRDFEARLAQLRSLYEQEVKSVKLLEDQLAQSRNESRKVQAEFAMLDGTYQDLRNQHQQLSSQVQAEHSESSTLKDKIRQINAEVAALKPAVEKLKSDVRHQKGLNAINRKQLSTVEGERDKLQGEHQSATKELEESRSEVHSAVPSSAAVASPAVASPAASVTSQNNPFFRRQATGTSDSGVGSPAASRATDPRSNFDAFFGPSFTTSSATPPPPTTFGTDSPAPSTAQGEPSTSGSPPASTLHDTPRVIEPPAPPASRQITSSALPFPQHLERAESVSSSVKVAPPASRLGAGETPRVGTPLGSVSASHSQAGSSPVEIEKADVESSQSAYFDQSQSSSLPQQQQRSGSEQDIPGAFPSFTPVAESPATLPNNEVKPAATDASFDDVFGGPMHARSSSQKAADFDAAFADIKGKEPVANGHPAPGAKHEFPPIQEFDGDDGDSDSDSSEEAPIGFDDNFTGTSPSKLKTEESHTTAAEPSQTLSPDTSTLQPPNATASASRPAVSSIPSNNSSLPGPDAQTSPPTYGDSVLQADDHFPAEYGDLLPHREDPTTEPPHSVDSTTGGPIDRKTSQSYGPESGKSPSQSMKSPPAPNFSNTDFDAAFASMNMGTAAADDSDDDLDTSFVGQGHNTDFDPTFDSPAAAAKATLPSSSQPTSSTFDAFDNFDSSISASQNPPPVTSGTAVNSSHDWDAIFASIDGPPTQSTSAFPEPSGAAHNATENAADHSVPNSSPPAVEPSGAATAPQRPTPGRALSVGTEHDDPILKRLTGMGWGRDEALKALEQYDYNLDKAIDHLTSK